MIARVSLLAVCAACAGCFGGDSLHCEDPAFYGSSFSVPPVRVPEGLDVPDESDALQIPSGEPFEVRDVETMTECLEAPPDFFDEEDADE
jgi:hypothetical protein